MYLNCLKYAFTVKPVFSFFQFLSLLIFNSQTFIKHSKYIYSGSLLKHYFEVLPFPSTFFSNSLSK